MIIYKVTNLINGKIYIGQTVRSIEERWKAHCGASLRRKSTLYFHQAIRKNGIENFKVVIIKRVTTQEDLNKFEKVFIQKYKSYLPEFGYNVTYGGSFGRQSEYAREKISKALKGRTPKTGIHNTEEQKRKISLSKKGIKKTEEHNRELSESLKDYFRIFKRLF